MNILVAEDDKDIQQIAKMALEALGGHQVSLVSNGKEAIEFLNKNMPDVILLDAMMPELNGFETCKHVQKNVKTKSIPIIFLSAKTEEKDELFAKNLGAVGYIKKPFDPLSLSKDLEKIIQSEKT